MFSCLLAEKISAGSKQKQPAPERAGCCLWLGGRLFLLQFATFNLLDELHPGKGI
jgi:hypothetical protein